MRGVCPDKHLRILYFNARSLYHKLDELRALCDMEKPDIVSITETWCMRTFVNLNPTLLVQVC